MNIQWKETKKHLLALFILFLFLFSGCKSASDVLDFPASADDVLEIKLLSEDLSLLTVGQMAPEAEELILTELVLNGTSDTVDGGYRYMVSEALPNLQQVYTAYRDTAATQGILLYRGFAYLVVREEQTQLLIPISPDTKADESMMASEFIKSVRAYQKSHPDTLSGGNGLG